MRRITLHLAVLVVTLLLLPGCGGKPAGGRVKVGFMPKLVPIPYFQACQRGAAEAAQELNLDLVYNGPNKAEVAPQIDLLNQWTAAGDFAVIGVACCDPDQIARALKDARAAGIPVVTYDADTQPEARDFFVNQATYDDVAEAMADALAEELEPKAAGKVALLTSSVTAPNQSQWARRIKAYVAKKYPQMEILGETEHGEDRAEGVRKARALIQANPDLKGIIGLTSVAVPAAAEAVRQAGQKGKIKVGGVSTPKDMRDYVEDGTVLSFILWNPVDLGYLAVHVMELTRQKKMPADGTIKAGRLGAITVRDREVLLGKPIRFDRNNIDKYDF